jgi:hypothetical protein
MVMEEHTTSMFRKPAEGGGIMCNFRLPPQFKIKSLFFRDVMQHKVVVIYQYFGTTYQSHLLKQSRRFFLECLTPEDNIPGEKKPCRGSEIL